jgi:hypothetical protein
MIVYKNNKVMVLEMLKNKKRRNGIAFNHGTAKGATTTAADGKFNRAGSFDGNDYVEVPTSGSLDITGAITVEAWVKPDNVSIRIHPIVNKYFSTEQGAGNNAYSFRLNLENCALLYMTKTATTVDLTLHQQIFGRQLAPCGWRMG